MMKRPVAQGRIQDDSGQSNAGRQCASGYVRVMVTEKRRRAL